MPRILLTAYEPYDAWESNVSQLVLERLTHAASNPAITPRVYPVTFSTIRELISRDLADVYDYAIHMGQAPGSTAVTLEAIGVNVAVDRGQSPEEGVPLVPEGAAAFQSQLPLGAWAMGLRQLGVPAAVSYHAGTYLCNAALYLSRYETEHRGLATQSVFLHLPLATEQFTANNAALPSLPLETTINAVRWILRQLD